MPGWQDLPAVRPLFQKRLVRRIDRVKQAENRTVLVRLQPPNEVHPDGPVPAQAEYVLFDSLLQIVLAYLVAPASRTSRTLSSGCIFVTHRMCGSPDRPVAC